MALDVLGQLVLNPGLLQADRSFACVEVLHVRQLVLLLVLVENPSQGAVFLHELLLAISELTSLQVVHDVEVLGGLVLQVEVVDDLIVRLRMVDDVAPMIIVSEDILSWVDKNFDLVADLDFKTN